MVMSTRHIAQIGVRQGRRTNQQKGRRLGRAVLYRLQGGETVEGMFVQGPAQGAGAHAAGQLEDRRQRQH